MSEFLFHVQWWIPTFLAVIGIALFINGNKAQVAKVRNAGAGLVAFALLWGMVSYFVDTDQEKVDKQTHEALDDVVAGKWPEFQAQLTPTAKLTVAANGDSGVDNAEMVTSFARKGAEMIKLKSAHVQNLTLAQVGTVITARFEILSTQDSFAPIETSSWDFVWEETSKGWKLRELKLTKLKDIENLDGITKSVGK